MSNRIIIDVQDNTSLDHVLDAVRLVILNGKISKTTKGVKHFCWVTTFRNGIVVYTRHKKKNQKSDSFLVRTEKR